MSVKTNRIKNVLSVFLLFALLSQTAFAYGSAQEDVADGARSPFGSFDDRASMDSSGDGADPAREESEDGSDKDESIEPLITDKQQGLDAQLSSHGDQASESGANSWRYSSNQLLFSSEGADPSRSGVSARSIVDNPSGYPVFNWFDEFSNGYCTGRGARRIIDVSEHNGNIDWAQVKASGVNAAIIRCGYGNDYSFQDDKKWQQNVRGCLENNIPFGVYIYSYATNASMARSEAEHVLRTIREAGLDASKVTMPIYLDLEDDSILRTDLASTAKVFAEAIRSQGFEMGVYASLNWWEGLLTDPCFNDWSKWVAEWNAGMGLTYSGFSDFKNSNGVWQFSDYGSVPGISTAVDLNYSYANTVAPGASTIQDGVYSIGTALSGSKTLDVWQSLTKDGANVQVWDSNGTAAQRFRVEYDGQGFYTIALASTGMALDVSSGADVDGVNVQIWSPNGTDAQKWRIDANGDGTYTLVSKLNGRVLDISAWPVLSNGSNAQVWSSNGTQAQRFTFSLS